jgi:hypothetical protein
MSTWTFDRRLIKTIIGLLLAASLTACGSSRLGKVTRSAPAQRSAIEIGGKKVTIKGPPGFCIDNQISQFSDDLAFILLGNCRVISPSAFGPSPKVKALLTASISGSGGDPDAGSGSIAGSLNSLDQFFRSETGRTALSRASDPGTVQVLETFQQDNTFFLRARDTSPGIVPGASDDYWRAYFDLQDQIVSVSVIGFQSDPISPDTGLATLREFARLIKDQNGVATTLVQTTTIEEPDEPEESEESKPRKKKKIRDPARTFWTLGLIRKLLN